jgi:hypothetical protein
MAQAATATRTGENFTGMGGGKDVVESVARDIDVTTKKATGISLFHLLTLGSIGASIALFVAGKKDAAIFVGLWPPTFQALKAVADTNKENKK